MKWVQNQEVFRFRPIQMGSVSCFIERFRQNKSTKNILSDTLSLKGRSLNCPHFGRRCETFRRNNTFEFLIS